MADSHPPNFDISRIIVFNYVDPQHYCRLNFGTNGNTQHALEQMSDDNWFQAATHSGSVETGKWYDVKLTVAGDSVRPGSTTNLCSMKCLNKSITKTQE